MQQLKKKARLSVGYARRTLNSRFPSLSSRSYTRNDKKGAKPVLNHKKSITTFHVSHFTLTSIVGLQLSCQPCALTPQTVRHDPIFIYPDIHHVRTPYANVSFAFTRSGPSVCLSTHSMPFSRGILLKQNVCKVSLDWKSIITLLINYIIIYFSTSIDRYS